MDKSSQLNSETTVAPRKEYGTRTYTKRTSAPYGDTRFNPMSRSSPVFHDQDMTDYVHTQKTHSPDRTVSSILTNNKGSRKSPSKTTRLGSPANTDFFNLVDDHFSRPSPSVNENVDECEGEDITPDTVRVTNVAGSPRTQVQTQSAASLPSYLTREEKAERKGSSLPDDRQLTAKATDTVKGDDSEDVAMASTSNKVRIL